MAIDLSSVGKDLATLQVYQQQLTNMAPNDPGRGILAAQIAGLQAGIAKDLDHAQTQADATANMFNQFEFTSMLGSAFSGLGAALPSAVALISKL